MDIYQIFITHNRMWSGQEILVFGSIFMIVLFLNITVRQSRQSGVARATCPD